MFLFKRIVGAQLCISEIKSVIHCARKIGTHERTIFALSSGRGKCGVAVVRVSGPKCRSILSAFAGESCLAKPRYALLRTIRDPVSNEVLDRAIVIWFPGPKSFTGEDTCEFQVHGGLAVVSGLLDALGKVPGVYPADPGEFSKRAFFNGSMDLTEAEGLADLIHAETEMQRMQALNQMNGSLHTIYERWRTTLLESLAHVEAFIDFSEDENIEDGVMDQVRYSLTDLVQEIHLHLADGRRGERLRDGVKATIFGEPNVGKSSLLNALCKRPAAIVTATPGTTRDVVEQYINLGGYPLSLADTAGIRGDSAVSDDVEKEGIVRAKQFAQFADIALLVIDAEQFLKSSNWQHCRNPHIFDNFVKTYMSKLGLQELYKHKLHVESNEILSMESAQTELIIILSKIDLIKNTSEKDSLYELESKLKNVVVVSCLAGDGFPKLLEKLKQSLETLCGNPNQESPALSQVRHRQHLRDCQGHIKNYLSQIECLVMPQKDLFEEEFFAHADLAICAEELRKAVSHLGRITGHVTTEQILDVIFRDFCIGK